MRITGNFLRKIPVLLLIVFLAFPSMAALGAHKGAKKASADTVTKVTTKEGLIESISDDSIEVRGKYYNVAGVTLLGPSGKTLDRDHLQVGKKVEIFFRGGRITSILIHNDMVE